MNEELVSIIVPIYNAADYLNKCIESIVNQTYINLDIILIDDGSTDDSSVLCDKWAAKDKRIRVVHQTNGGVSAARNAGLEIAIGKYLAFVDSDDYISENMIKTLVDSLVVNSAQMSVCGLIKNGETLVSESVVKCSNNKALQMMFDIDGFPYFEGYLCNKMFLMNIIRENNFKLDVRYKLCEDTLFTFNYLKKISFVSVAPYAEYYYCIRENSASNQRNTQNDYAMVSIIEYFFNNTDDSAQMKYVINWSLKYLYRIVDDDIREKNGKEFSKRSIKCLKRVKKTVLFSAFYSASQKLYMFSICYFRLPYSLYKSIKYTMNK